MPRRRTNPKPTPPADLTVAAPREDTPVRPVRRRAAGEGTIYREGKYWVVEVQWTNELGTHRRRRKRTTRTAAVAARDALVQDIRDGAVAVGPDAQTTVAKALENYLTEARERVRARTFRDYAMCA
jgi:post-segregation antitoxin (ccd killing protein)